MIIRCDHITIGACEDPQCGIHIRMHERNGDVICDAALNEKQALAFVEHLRASLYERVTKKDF